MNWAKVVSSFRHAFMDNVVIEGKNANDLREYFREEMVATDTFHPWNTDGMLSRALDATPLDVDEATDALYNVFEEMKENTEEWFGNPWNHPPGYHKPEKLSFRFDMEQLATASIQQVMEAA